MPSAQQEFVPPLSRARSLRCLFDGTLVSITIPLGFFAVSLPAPVYYDELERGRALQLIGSGPLHREGHFTVTVTCHKKPFESNFEISPPAAIAQRYAGTGR